MRMHDACTYVISDMGLVLSTSIWCLDDIGQLSLVDLDVGVECAGEGLDLEIVSPCSTSSHADHMLFEDPIDVGG